MQRKDTIDLCASSAPYCEEQRALGNPIHVVTGVDDNWATLALGRAHFRTVEEAVNALTAGWSTAPLIESDEQYAALCEGDDLVPRVAHKLPAGWVHPSRR